MRNEKGKNTLRGKFVEARWAKPVSISYYCCTCTWLPSSDGLFYWTPYLLPWRLRWRVWHTSKWNPYWMKHVPAATGAAAAAVTALRLRNWLAGSPLMSALFTHRYMCVQQIWQTDVIVWLARSHGGELRTLLLTLLLWLSGMFFVWMHQRFKGAQF